MLRQKEGRPMLLQEETPLVIWRIRYCAPPAALRYCKKCKKKSEFICSGEFRINAQQKELDIRLIYKCARCNATWNSTIFSRVSPQKLEAGLLERFLCNDKDLAMRYAMDLALLQRNGAEIKLPAFQVMGEEVPLEKAARIKIQSQYALPLKTASVLRAKLGVSQREFDALLRNNRIISTTGQDLKKCKLSSEETIVVILAETDLRWGH